MKAYTVHALLHIYHKYHKGKQVRWLTIMLTAVAATLCILNTACQMQSTVLMPQFSAMTLAKTAISNQQLQKKVSVIHFWATSCETCIKEMPRLIASYQKFSQSHPQTFSLLSINMPNDPPNYVLAYQKAQNIPFPIVLDVNGALSTAFDARLTPTTFIYNQKGERVQTIVGEPDWQQFEQLLTKMLNAS